MNRSESPTAGLVQVRSALEFSNRPYRNIISMLSRRGLVVLWLACVMSSADDEACALQKPLGKPKIRDNYVYFLNGYDGECNVQRVEYDETSHSITQGQPYEGVFTRGSYLDVKAGRHGSEEVAHDFNAGILSDNALGLLTSKSDPGLPSELNFAVFGTMSVTMCGATSVCPEMRIAQGHRFTQNNWWIAGTKCYSNTDGLRCPCGHTNLTFSQGPGDFSGGLGSNAFIVRSDSIKPSNSVASS